MSEDNLVSFVLDQLSDMGGIRSRRMFGGWHISIDGVFFAAVHGERLYFKTSEASRERYESMGMGPFRPRATVTLKSLYEVPIDILEDAKELTAWGNEAVACQLEAQRKKNKPRKKKSSKNQGKGA